MELRRLRSAEKTRHKVIKTVNLPLALRVQFQPQGRARHLLYKVECKVTMWSPLFKFD